MGQIYSKKGLTRAKNGEIRWREGNSPGIEEYCLTLEKKRIRAKKCDFPAKRTSDTQQWNLLQKVGIFSFIIWTISFDKLSFRATYLR